MSYFHLIIMLYVFVLMILLALFNAKHRAYVPIYRVSGGTVFFLLFLNVLNGIFFPSDDMTPYWVQASMAGSLFFTMWLTKAGDPAKHMDSSR